MNFIFRIMDQCDTKIDLIKFVYVSELHFWPYILMVSVIDFNYFDTLNDGTCQGYSCPSGHLL